MKNIGEQATNKLKIVGKLLDCTFRNGTLKTGSQYESVNFTIRTTHTYSGREETSEIPVSIFATPTTSTGKAHPGWRCIQEMKQMKTVQEVGEAAASRISLTSANVRENNFVTRSGQLISGWQINTPFISNGGNISDTAIFDIDIFIMDMHDELDREGDPTGRFIVKGGVVQYGGKLDVIEFVVEQQDYIDFVQRNWNVNDTVHAGGHIRYTSVEEKRTASNSSWGEEVEETSTRTARELIITRGSDEPFEEEFAYDPADIKKAFNVRKANIEQLQINATNKPAVKPAAESSKYSWE